MAPFFWSIGKSRYCAGIHLEKENYGIDFTGSIFGQDMWVSQHPQKQNMFLVGGFSPFEKH